MIAAALFLAGACLLAFVGFGYLIEHITKPDPEDESWN